jgi:DNA sulfur modification protein DndD
MKLVELRVKNFGPYKEEQQIRFPQDESRNVLLIWGPNMWGKTSLLNSIRWVLYDKALDRHGKPIPRLDLVNRECRENGEWDIRVSIEFYVDQDHFEITRELSRLELVANPKQDSDFKTEFRMRKNGDVQRGDIAKREISDVLPEDISRFFLFDAESLQAYETLVSKTQGQEDKIKDSIEQALGVPALINGRDHLSHLLSKASSSLSKLAKKEKETEGVSKNFDQVEKQVSAFETDLKDLQQKHAATEAEVDKDDDYLKKNQEAERQKGNLDQIENQLKSLKKQQIDLEQDALQVRSKAWLTLLQPRINQKLDSLLVKRNEVQKEIGGTGANTSLIEVLKSVIGKDECPVCQTHLTEQQKEAIGTHLGNLEYKSEVDPAQKRDLDLINEQMNVLQKSKIDPVTGELRRIDKNIAKNEVEITKLENQKKAILEQIKGFDTVALSRTRVRREQNTAELAKLQVQIVSVKKDLDQKQKEKSALTQIMQQASAGKGERISLKVNMLEGLKEIFDEGISTLRDRLRDEVSRNATVAFKSLTTEHRFKGLKINDRYGLTIVDSSGRDVEQRSAGAEQIVALSLIDGLNKVAEKDAPIVMDTPMGRLDLDHRTNVLKHLTTMSNQVILLVHDGELDPESGSEPINEKIDSVYEIKRISDSESTIERKLD